MNENNAAQSRRGFLKKLFGSVFTASLLADTGNTFASSEWQDIKKVTKNTNNPSGILSVEPYIGEILILPYNTVPGGYMPCNGQLINMADNPALYALIGTTYGGNSTQFALPDFRGRSPLGDEDYTLGTTGGETQVTLSTLTTYHTHTLGYSTNYGTSDSPAGLVPAKNASAIPQYMGTTDSNMGSSSSAGAGLPHNNMPPYIVLNFVIAVAGIFPSQT